MMTHKVSFAEAVLLFFRNYANFRGRSTRREYWFMFLVNAIYTFFMEIWVFEALLHMPLLGKTQDIVLILKAIWLPIAVAAVIGLATLIPWISLSIRRLRDADISPWWLLATMLAPSVLLSLPISIAPTFGNVCLVVGLALTVLHIVFMAHRSVPSYHN